MFKNLSKKIWHKSQTFRSGTILFSIFATFLVTIFAIYLTPLKHFNMISPAMNEVDPKEFYSDLVANPNDYIFIDVRSPSIYQSAHAKGSINVPIENLYDEHYLLPKTGKKIALICTTGRLAAIGYGYLENWGFRNLVHIQGGVQNWSYESLPLEGKNVNIVNIESGLDAHQ